MQTSKVMAAIDDNFVEYHQHMICQTICCGQLVPEAQNEQWNILTCSSRRCDTIRDFLGLHVEPYSEVSLRR